MAKGYVAILKRRRSGKTDYRLRKRLLMGRKAFIAPRISNRNITVQVIQAELKGDKVLASAHSRELLRYGWRGSRTCLPAAYLTGLLAGMRALRAGVQEAYAYLGVARFVRGSRAMAALKGVQDGGVKVPIGEEALPPEDRIVGKHIAEYAKKLKEEDERLYRRRFSYLLRTRFDPLKYPELFERVKAKIMKEEGGRAKEAG